MPQLQLLTSKETQSNALQFVSEAELMSYKTLKEDNDRMGKIIEAIIRKVIVSVSFTHSYGTKITRKPHENGSTYF